MRRRLPTLLGWALCVVLGLALGWLCRFPLINTWLTGWVVAMEAGWAAVDPTMVDDGISIYFVFITGLWLFFAAIAGPLTMLARRWARLPARPWWWTSVALWLVPAAVLDLPALLG
ncbi:hypothetical protein QOZ88_19950 [Blastococcus sp. BMG 814]|uniref:Uncharacterized protein n=1 Tax=Blastococcus carthaginiensis TaxID=3050034 RepID=A0ABT9IH65_9ACTN|nr:hypothetical protein [Blastococcus carthaginiensis]MDP5184913.1 hypothetical protein [Blastococcus carthaginiensis]